MRPLSNFAAIWLSILTLVLVLAGHFLWGQGNTKFIADLCVLGILAYHTINYAAPAIRAVRRGASTGVDRLNVGIWGIWLAFFCQRCILIATAALGRPAWLTTSVAGSIVACLIFVAGMYMAAAPVSDDVELPRRETWIMVLAAMFAGAVMATGAILALLGFTGQLPGT